MPTTTCEFSVAEYRFIASTCVPDKSSLPTERLSLAVACVGPRTGALYVDQLEMKELCVQCPMITIMPSLLAEFIGPLSLHTAKYDQGGIDVTFELKVGFQTIKLVVQLKNVKNQIETFVRETSQFVEKTKSERDAACQREEILKKEIARLELKLDQVRETTAQQQKDLSDEVVELQRKLAERNGEPKQSALAKKRRHDVPPGSR